MTGFRSCLFSLLVLCSAGYLAAQTPATDSILSLLKENARRDTVAVNLMLNLFREYKGYDLEKAMICARDIYSLSEQLQYSKGMAKGLNNVGIVHYYKGDYDSALVYYNQSTSISKALGDQQVVGFNLNNIGVIYKKRGDYVSAIAHYDQALKIFESLNRDQPDNDAGKKGMVSSLNNIGGIYYYQSDYERALDYFLRSLLVKEELGDKRGIAYSENNIGAINVILNNLDDAKAHYQRALDIRREIGDRHGVAQSLNNLGELLSQQENFEEALKYCKEAFAINKELDNTHWVAVTLHSIGIILEDQGINSGMDYFLQSLELRQELNDQYGVLECYQSIGKVKRHEGDYVSALKHLTQGLKIALEIGVKDYMKQIYFEMSAVHEAQNNFQQSLEYYKLFTQAKDSLFNEDKSKEIGKLEARYEFDKAEAEKKREAEEMRSIEREAEQRRNNLQYSGILIVIVALFAGIFMIGRLSIPIRLAEGIVFFTFLLFFEFTLVLLDPYIENYSGGAPAYKLLFNAVLAGLIFPLHAFFESRMKGRILN